MDANTLGTQLTDLQTKLGQYGSELPGQIKEEVRKAWAPSLQEAAGVVGKQISQFLPSYYGMAEKLGGTTAADISPTARLSQMGNYLGELGGNLATATNYGDYLGANMKNAYGDALNAMQMGQQGLQQQYQNTFGQYQLAKQLEEAEKQRQLQRSLSGGGGGNYYIPEPPKEIDYTNAYGNLINIAKTKGLSAQQRYNLAQQIISNYPEIDLVTAYEKAGFSPYWNPALNPNKWNNGVQIPSTSASGVSYQYNGKPVSKK